MPLGPDFTIHAGLIRPRDGSEIVAADGGGHQLLLL